MKLYLRVSEHDLLLLLLSYLLSISKRVNAISLRALEYGVFVCFVSLFGSSDVLLLLGTELRTSHGVYHSETSPTYLHILSFLPSFPSFCFFLRLFFSFFNG